ncbi:hypothetical protein MTR67_020301 [Solanum verrucosum]|uniref:Uncharacterized protein n=1 Tax=Solanum verrucosum TaxID=315347 RepID=A0AAF0TP19_SOLVR|nr:hypothetical protein MTR67_020301 [Solanum verrucosum]
MVCQAASQTRFRALKHENGIDGSATIIVRVIACFQPLQDCQAEYFRHLLKPVTKSARNNQQFVVSQLFQTGMIRNLNFFYRFLDQFWLEFI